MYPNTDELFGLLDRGVEFFRAEAIGLDNRLLDSGASAVAPLGLRLKRSKRQGKEEEEEEEGQIFTDSKVEEEEIWF